MNLVILSSSFAQYNPSQGLVPCGTRDNPCRIEHIFIMLSRIYDFLVKWVASPLAIIAITVGAIIIMTSTGNPNQQALGKRIVSLAIIGLTLVWGSWLIIDFILKTLGYTQDWSTL